METEIGFTDPFFLSSMTRKKNDIMLTYPVADTDNIQSAIHQIRENSESYFSQHSLSEIQEKLDIVDHSFCNLQDPEIQNLIDFIHQTSGFSKHDIGNYGLGIFPLLIDYNREKIGQHVTKALESTKVIETEHGYLKRFGMWNPFRKWKEPKLLSHFISGNVVGYTAVFSKIGFPIKKSGTAQIIKLPSASALFPMAYLKKLESVDPDLRKTIACGYWKGGDDNIEKIIIKESDAINILSSDSVIQDLSERIKKYNPKITSLLHGHKISIAYISNEFLQSASGLDKVLDGLTGDISAFDGGACYNVKNIYVQGEVSKFSEMLFDRLNKYSESVSPVSIYSKRIANSLYQTFMGSGEVLSSKEKNAFVRVKNQAEFWKPEELFRYVQVMPVKDEKNVYEIIKKNRHYLQTAIVAVPDEKIISILDLFGKAGISNIHYPGSAPFFQVYEEPHDGEFDYIKVRYKYSARFASTNFKKNKDWL